MDWMLAFSWHSERQTTWPSCWQPWRPSQGRQRPPRCKLPTSSRSWQPPRYHQIFLNTIRSSICNSVVDPDSFNPDPDADPGFWWPKIEKNSAEIVFYLSLIKNWDLHIPRPPSGRPSYRRGLQPSKENILNFKIWKLLPVFFFSVPFLVYCCESGSGFGSRGPIESGSNPDTDPIHNIGLYIGKYTPKRLNENIRCLLLSWNLFGL